MRKDLASVMSMLATLAATAGCAPSVTPGPSMSPPPAPSSPPITLQAPGVSAASVAPEAAGPLHALPYTPGLDVTSLDRSADACSNFYHFACGQWIRNNPIPTDQSSWSVYAKLSKENQRFLWGILEELRAEERADRTAEQQKIGDYFAACMDEATIEKRGKAAIEPSLALIDAMTSVRDLAPVLARLQLSGAGEQQAVLFGFGAEEDAEDSRVMIARIGTGGLGLPDRDYYVKTDPKSAELRQKYVAHVTKLMSLLGDPAETAAHEAGVILGIETDLAGATLTRVQRRNPHNTFHRTKRGALLAMTPSIDWDAFFSAVGAPPFATLDVSQPAFMTRLEKELHAVPLADWKSYLRWRVVNASAAYLAPAFANENFEFNRHILRGTLVERPRWQRCVSWIDDHLGEAIGAEFVRRTFTAETARRAQAMTTAIEKAMADSIERASWMGPRTKREALEKLHAVVTKIGHPEHFRDYGSVTIERDDFAGDVSRALGFEERRDIAKIGKPVDRAEWFETPSTVDAYYNSRMNDMNFPAGVLQPPLFDVKLDEAPSYGDTGSTMGHELTHGFDDHGRQYDARGNLRDWWTKGDAAAFEKRASCVVDQYAGYTIVDDVHINSKLTEGEDIADLGGTMLAYAAWKAVTAGSSLLPLDGYTPDQRFFIGFAQWACGSERPEALRLRAVTAEHSPYEFRINGVVANMPEFHEAFACKAGQPMVRAVPCRVW